VNPFDGFTPAPAPGPVTANTPPALPAVPSAGRGLLARFTALPKVARFGLVGGVAAVLVLAAIGLSGAFGGGTPSASRSARPSSAPPPFPVQTLSDDRGFSIEVPVDWNKTKGGTYYDFTDPVDGARRMRVNVEPAGSTARAFMQVVVNVLSRDPRKCPAPYTTVNLRTDVTLAGHPAAELEYTCGSGPDMRHGIWRATVVGGKAYEFYLSTEDSRFAESRAVYDHAVESYRLSV
jgi:hypothetical protein